MRDAATSYYWQQKWNRCGTTGSNLIEGHACIWGQRDDNGNLFQRGAFADELRRRDSIGLWLAHLQEYALPVSQLTLREDDVGLYFGAIVSDSSLSRDFVLARKCGYFAQCSMGWDTDNKDESGRITRARGLREISLTTRAAQQLTSNYVAGVDCPSGPQGLPYSLQDRQRVEALLSVVDSATRSAATPSALSWNHRFRNRLREGLAADKAAGPKRRDKARSREQLAKEFVQETRQLIADMGEQKVNRFFDALTGGSDGWTRVVCSGAMRR